MDHKDLQDIHAFFPDNPQQPSPEATWDSIFGGWIRTLEEEQRLLSLFEMKLWFEGLEYFLSPQMETLFFQDQPQSLRDYAFHTATLQQVMGRLISRLKELDFKKDRYLMNFEEFIVDRILESATNRPFPLVPNSHSPESWFYSLRLFLRNLRTLATEVQKNGRISYRTFLAVKKIYHKEVLSNPFILTLLKKPLIPRLDKIYHSAINSLIHQIDNRDLKRPAALFYVSSFRTLKICNYLDAYTLKNKPHELLLPLALTLLGQLESTLGSFSRSLKPAFLAHRPDEDLGRRLDKLQNQLEDDYKKMRLGDIPLTLGDPGDRMGKRKIFRNIVILTETTLQHAITELSHILDPSVDVEKLFENRRSRCGSAQTVRRRIQKLIESMREQLEHPKSLSRSDVLYELSHFMETDLHLLYYKDWTQFADYVMALQKAQLSDEFMATLRSFLVFMNQLEGDYALPTEEEQTPS